MSHAPRIAVLGLLLSALASTGAPASAQAPMIFQEEHYVPSGGFQIYVRNKYPQGQKHFTLDRVLLFVHGATYPFESTFDLPLDGNSWMDLIAQKGYDVYAMDVRGYGASTRPSQMRQPPDKSPPVVHTDDAVSDLAAVVDFILKRRNVAKLDLLSWSWGTVITGAYTAQNSGNVHRLVLYGPVWLRQTPPLVGGDGPLGAYRTVTMAAARQRWLTGVPAAKQADLFPPIWFTAFSVMTIATDPAGAQETPPVIRAPNGVIADSRAYWSAGKPYYDPSTIAVPVLLIHGEWDADTPAYMSQALLPKLTQAPFKRYVVVGEGTHTLMLERNRDQLFHEVQLFLDEIRE